MMPFDDSDDCAPKSVPDLIKTLWSLYMEMSLDPAMDVPACHVRSAALALEKARRMALQVCQEEERRPRPASAANPKTARGGKRRSRKSRENQEAAAEWLRSAPAASPSKH